jgi:hypothetical protein
VAKKYQKEGEFVLVYVRAARPTSIARARSLGIGGRIAAKGAPGPAECKARQLVKRLGR